jgi:hypothetical protein
MSTILIAEDLDELLKLSDRIAVMFRGKLVGYADPRRTSREEIGLMMSGEQRTINTMKLVIERRDISSPCCASRAPVSRFHGPAVPGLLLLAAGINPLAAYREILVEAVGSVYGLSETLVKATPLIICRPRCQPRLSHADLEHRCRRADLHGCHGRHLGRPFSGWQPLAADALHVRAAFLCGGLWAGVAGFLRARWQVNEVIVTLMMNYIAILFVDYLVYGPWRDPKGFNFPLTAQFQRSRPLFQLFRHPPAQRFFLLALLCAAFLSVHGAHHLGLPDQGHRQQPAGGPLCRECAPAITIFCGPVFQRRGCRASPASVRLPGSSTASSTALPRLRLHRHHHRLAGATQRPGCRHCLAADGHSAGRR